MAKSLRHPPRDRIPAFRAWLPGKALPRNPVAARGSSAGGACWLQVICEANDAGDSGRKEARRKVCGVAPFRQRITPLTALARDGRVGAADGRRTGRRTAADSQATAGATSPAAGCRAYSCGNTRLYYAYVHLAAPPLLRICKPQCRGRDLKKTGPRRPPESCSVTGEGES